MKHCRIHPAKLHWKSLCFQKKNHTHKIRKFIMPSPFFFLGRNELTLVILRPKYSQQPRSILWLLLTCHTISSHNIDCAHYDDVKMGVMASQITSLTIVYSTVYSDADQRKHQSSASLAFVWGIHRGSANSPHKWPVTRNLFPFHDVIMREEICLPSLRANSNN